MTEQARSAQRREALREAAADVLLEDGFDAVTHRAVAARSGVPLGSTTYYFSDRQDLLAQALQRAASRWVEASQAAVTALPRRLVSRPAVARAVLSVVVAGSGGADLRSLYERYLEAGRAEPLRALVLAYDDELVSLLAQVLGRAGRDPRAARLVLAAADGLLLSAVARGAADPAAEALPELVRLVGLLPA